MSESGARGTTQIVLVGRVPSPGRSKTRLMPDLTPEQAAAVTEALLVDLMTSGGASQATARTLALDATPPDWLRDCARSSGWDLIAQVDGDLGDRLLAAAQAAYAARPQPFLLMPTDTPLVTPKLLDACARELVAPDVDAVLGLAQDGGWWALGLRRPEPRLFEDIVMSTATTGVDQLQRLRTLGLRVALLPTLSDVDVMADLVAVRPKLSSETRLAALLESVLGRAA